MNWKKIRRHSYAVGVALLFFAGPASANTHGVTMASVKGTLADRIMHQATMQMTHDGPGGLNQDQLSISDLLTRYDNGERLYIRCGTQAMVSQALLARYGIRSRLISVVAMHRPFGGHTFMEVWIKHHWIAYDPDGNRMPVDGQGNPMGAVRELAQARSLHWRYIASDPYSEAYPDYTYKELNRAVRHVLGVLSIMDNSDWRYDSAYPFLYRGTAVARRRMESYPINFGWVPVGKKRWAKITKGEA